MSKIYKSKDAETIYEYIKEFEEETERRNKFINALKRELVKGHYAQEKLEHITGKKIDESWENIEK